MLVGAVMVPHPPIAAAEIGKGEERKIQTTLDSFRKTAAFIAEKHPDTIIVITPHAVMYQDWFNVSKGDSAYGDFGRYRAEQVSFHAEYDTDFVEQLDQLCRRESFPAGTAYDNDPLLDQGTMVPLYFINQAYSDYRLVRIGLSGLPLSMHYRFGMLIQKICEADDKRYLIAASGDLSHCEKEDGPYGFHKEGPEYDARIMDDMEHAAFGNLLSYSDAFLDRAQECGHRSFTILGGILDRTAVKAEKLSHEATFGVGYGFVLYEPAGSDETRNFLEQYEEAVKKACSHAAEAADAYVSLARHSIQEWTTQRRKLSVPSSLPKEMLEKQAGVFVSIHEHGRLRGCIGTIGPCRKNVAEEIIANAISACSRDPRFEPVEESELPYLEISVDELFEPEEIEDPSMLDVKRYGVIVSAPDGRRGLLLPNLEGVDTIEEQISIARSKGGISEYEPYMLERFEVVRHA